jgi:hypothetical protein
MDLHQEVILVEISWRSSGLREPLLRLVVYEVTVI